MSATQDRCDLKQDCCLQSHPRRDDNWKPLNHTPVPGQQVLPRKEFEYDLSMLAICGPAEQSRTLNIHMHPVGDSVLGKNARFLATFW